MTTCMAPENLHTKGEIKFIQYVCKEFKVPEKNVNSQH